MSGTERRGSAYRCRRCVPRSRPESALTHTVTHTGKRADGNNGTNRLRPHPFWTKKRRKALYSKGWKALRWLVRMRSAVQFRPAAPESPETSRFMFIGTQCDLWGRPDGTGKQGTDREIKLSTHKDNINDRLEQCQITGRDLW